MKTITPIFIAFILCSIGTKAQTVTLNLEGNVVSLIDSHNVLNGAVDTGDTLTATVIYYTNISDNNQTDNAVGDYYNTVSHAGIVVKIDTFTFQTDSSNRNLLVESVCKPSNDGGCAIVFRSYNNYLPATHISWQIDDAFGTALKNDSLVTQIDLNKFEQLIGFIISAYDTVSENNYEISGTIAKIITTVRDIDNIIINTDTSILIADTIVMIDTVQANVADHDGNIYKTVKIGEQVWLRENVKSLHYADGTPINGVYVYNNDESNAPVYGRLYTWKATMRGLQSSINIPSGVQGVCPDGWHLPSDNEWYTLIKYLGGVSVVGAKMKEAGTEYWENPNEGAENTSFLTVRSASYRQSGNYYPLGTTTAFWTTAEYHENYARYVFLDNLTTRAVIYNDADKTDCYSVRCIKGEVIPASHLYDIHQENHLELYPNPTSQVLFISGCAQNTTIQICDLNGRIVFSNQISIDPIDIQQLKSGIYIVKIVDKNGVTTRKIVKE